MTAIKPTDRTGTQSHQHRSVFRIDLSQLMIQLMLLPDIHHKDGVSATYIDYIGPSQQAVDFLFCRYTGNQSKALYGTAQRFKGLLNTGNITLG